MIEYDGMFDECLTLFRCHTALGGLTVALFFVSRETAERWIPFLP